MHRFLPPSLLACALAWAACSKEEPPEAAHEPQLPTPILAEDEPEPEDDEAPTEPGTDTEASDEQAIDTPEDEPSEPKAKATAPAKAKPKNEVETKTEAKTEAKPKSEAKAETKPAPETKPEAKPEPEQPKQRTRIPSTKHVQVDVSPKMQTRLDSDSRMQGWIDKVMPVANQCYAQARSKNPEAGGTIVVKVTMHENARPTPDITQLPPALASLVACATGKLFRVRMPLFTGPEGEKHVVKLHFKP